MQIYGYTNNSYLHYAAFHIVLPTSGKLIKGSSQEPVGFDFLYPIRKSPFLILARRYVCLFVPPLLHTATELNHIKCEDIYYVY